MRPLILIFTCLMAPWLQKVSLGADNYDPNRLADAIFRAEGVKSRHPYGILTVYRHTTPRQACLNSIASAQRRFDKQTKEKDFVVFLSKTYCPVGAKNDPTGLNKNWTRLVKYFLTKQEHTL